MDASRLREEERPVSASPIPLTARVRQQLASSSMESVLIIKTLVLLLGAVAYQVLLNQSVRLPQGFFDIWNGWDAPHYVELAQHWYQATGDDRYLLVFYPLYPACIRAVAALGLNAVAAAFAVSTIASLVLALLLYQLARLDFGPEAARRAVWFLFIFPTSFVLHIGYTESLFLALAVGSFLAARSERWWLAGILGALACLTRNNGVLLGPALGVEAALQGQATGRWQWHWLWLGLLPLGFSGFLLLNYQVSGDPLRFLTYEHEYWFKSLAWPWVGLGDTLRSLSWRGPSEAQMIVWQEVLFAAIGVLGTGVAVWRLRPSYTVWMGLNVLVFVSTTFVLSVPRYTLILFPLFFLFAELAKTPRWNVALTTWSLLFLAFFTALFATGHWAF
jgi:Dolichyl-phosphate-mannose-protein mannosyltransferase